MAKKEIKKSIRKLAIWNPNKHQTLFAEYYLDLDANLTKTDSAKKSGVSRQAMNKWYDNDNFVNWINAQTDKLLIKSRTDRKRKAIQRARNGDFNFSKLIFEIEGEYTPTLKQDINIKVTEIIISHVVEVINKHVPDENIRKNIAEALSSICLN